MCTAIRLKNNHYYVGRTLDLEYNYDEKVIIVPRKFPIKYKYLKQNDNHFSIFGIGIIIDNYPLFYDACNEYGLSICGLNMPLSTNYSSFTYNKINITSYELIIYLLSECKNLKEVKNKFDDLNITDDNFNANFLASKLHFLITENNESIVLEIIDGKINIYNNKIGVLTNEPQFPFHLYNLNNYDHLSKMTKNNYFKGSGLIGLPGDNLSTSRFIKAAFSKNNFIISKNISEIFNIFNNIFEINGLNITLDNKVYKTIYISLYDLSNKILYFKTYNNCQIYQVILKKFNIDDYNLSSKQIYNDETIINLF